MYNHRLTSKSHMLKRVLEAVKAPVYLVTTEAYPDGLIVTNEALGPLKAKFGHQHITAIQVDLSSKHLSLPFIGSLDVQSLKT